MDASIDAISDARTASTRDAVRPRTAGETLAVRLRHARLSRGWSQRNLAARAFMNSAAIQKIENGKSLRPRNIVAIAEALEVEPSWLMFGDSDAPPSLSAEAIAVAKAWSELPEQEREALRDSLMRLSRRG